MDNEIIKAMKELITPLAESINRLEKGQKELRDNALSQSQRIDGITDQLISVVEGQQALSDQVTKTQLMIENEISPKIDAIYEGYQFTRDRAKSNETAIEESAEKIEHHDILIKSHDVRIKKLEQGVG